MGMHRGASDGASRGEGHHRPGHEEGCDATPVGIVSAIDPILRDSLVMGLLFDTAGLACLRYDVDTGSGQLRRLITDAGGVVEDVMVELDHPCVSCAMREDAVPTLSLLSADPSRSAILLVPPISADPSVVAGALAPSQGGWRLSGVAAVLSAESVIEDVMGDDTLEERGLQWASEDERSVGEALVAQIEHADLLIVGGGDEAAPASRAEAGLELIEHLRGPEQRLIGSLHHVEGAMLLEGEHDLEAALRRRDIRHVEPYGGPTAHGTWTLDLSSERPFHPQRLLENIELLGAGRMRARGRFWVPDRPGAICQWDGAGGQVSIGAAHEAGRDLPTTRLVITGIDPEDLPRVRDAFARSLLTPEEWEAGLAPWLGAEDPLAPWLGDRDARV